jgi:hypothetical protein
MKKRIEFGNLWIYLSIVLGCATTGSAQNEAVRNTKTDRKYGNTTEVYKKGDATDNAVLGEIEKDYGLGDVVRITVAPPPPPPVEELEKPKLTALSNNNDRNIPVLNVPNIINPIPTGKDIRTTPEVTDPNLTTSTYTNTGKDSNINRPSTTDVKLKTFPVTQEEMPIASNTPSKKSKGILPPPVIENLDMRLFNKGKEKIVSEKITKTTSVKVSMSTKTTKNNSFNSIRSYNSKSCKKKSWFSFFGKKKMTPTRRKVSGKEPGCYRF